MNPKNMARLLLVALLVLLCSCSREADSSIPVGEKELPQMVMHDATYTVGRPEDEPLVISAVSIEVDSQFTRLEGVSFTQGDDISGTCSQAVLETGIGRTTLLGEVCVYRSSDEVSIQAEKLVWDQDAKLIQSDGAVTVQYGDGTVLEAEGFTARLEDKTYEFSKILEGRLSD